MSNRREQGFSTLEVIAAVAIIGIALIPIEALQTQISRSQARLMDVHAESTSVQNAMALLREVNPMLTPAGERRLDERTSLTWTSTPLSAPRPSTNAAGFEVQLYRVSANIRRSNATPTTLQVDLIGWRSISDPPSE